ncbi:MAG: glycosyl hydrolase family 28-related protein [Jatrophihabitans sp.]|uniref:glycosyl hydrolase family 28-related protein n=1 Tax=Jatrophihabitans sp. TaxID=1932789 RepID=UPI003F7EEBF1
MPDSTARLGRALAAAVLLLAAFAALVTGAASASAAPPASPFGPNVLVFDPSMSTADIQAQVDAVAAQQVGNQFGTQRYALLFEPGTYGTADQPLNFQVGYYTEVAGLGTSPGDVTINGSVYVRNQCDASGCIALNNFWRSLSNLTIDVSTPGFGCYSGEFWAVSQAAPMRRVHVHAADGSPTTLMDYCTGPSFASGGFIADSTFDNTLINGSQQQFFTRNTNLTTWTNGVWNQVFAGSPGAPATSFPSGNQYTTLATTPVERGKPFLSVDPQGRWQVSVPPARTDSTGPNLGTARTIPLSDFFVAHPGDPIQAIDNALARGKNLLLTPGVYDVDRSIEVKRADTVVLGLGFATLTAQHGAVPITVANVPGVDLAGIVVDAGPVSSPTLVRIGTAHGNAASVHSDASDPTALQDVFFRVGGPHAGKAEVSLEVNSDHVVLDDIWAWRADHGTGVGWTQNTGATGLVVNGDDVTATGLFVEHYQRHEVVWNGERGEVVFFQNEMPYDVPDQASWNSAPGTLGYAALKVAPTVRTFTGWGMGSYSFFNQHVDIHASHAFEVPTTPGVQLHDLLTIFLDATNGSGGIDHVVTDTGGSSTAADADVPVTVVGYP